MKNLSIDHKEPILIPDGKKIFFLSDAHLGAPDKESSLKREKKLVHFLNSIEKEAFAIYLVGDIFDFWFEYKYSIPKGYTRLFGQLRKMVDNGIDIHFFKGNHDMWTFGYFEVELGMKVYDQAMMQEINGKKFFITHGDALGPVPAPVKWMKRTFDSKILQWCFARLHPNFSFGLANKFSGVSRQNNMKLDNSFKGEEKEELIIFSKEILKEYDVDFFIFGHRHLLLDLRIEQSRFFTLGDWVVMFSYGVFDRDGLIIKTFK